MARTFKDSIKKYHFKDFWAQDRIQLEGYGCRLAKTTKPKKRKEVDTEDHWMRTPSWWTHLVMIRPQRRAGKLWESKFVNSDIDMWALEEADAPIVRNKPYIYFY